MFINKYLYIFIYIYIYLYIFIYINIFLLTNIYIYYRYTYIIYNLAYIAGKSIYILYLSRNIFIYYLYICDKNAYMTHMSYGIYTYTYWPTNNIRQRGKAVAWSAVLQGCASGGAVGWPGGLVCRAGRTRPRAGPGGYAGGLTSPLFLAGWAVAPGWRSGLVSWAGWVAQ